VIIIIIIIIIITGRRYTVCIGWHASAVTSCTVGVPQGSVLGTLLFSIYKSLNSTIAQSHLVSQQQYADDTQLYISFSPSELSGQINAVQLCLASFDSWFCENGLALNSIESDAILFGTHQRLKSLTNLKAFNVARAEISHS